MTRVKIVAPPDAYIWTTKWWPQRGDVTGTVQKTFKNGKVAVAIDQLRNRSDDGRKTMNLPAEWLQPIEEVDVAQLQQENRDLRAALRGEVSAMRRIDTY